MRYEAPKYERYDAPSDTNEGFPTINQKAEIASVRPTVLEITPMRETQHEPMPDGDGFLGHFNTLGQDDATSTAGTADREGEKGREIRDSPGWCTRR